LDWGCLGQRESIELLKHMIKKEKKERETVCFIGKIILREFMVMLVAQNGYALFNDCLN
jgi:hypothetical protein